MSHNNYGAFSTAPKEPSYLHVAGLGYLAIVQWKLTLSELPLQQHCVVFTPDNMGSGRDNDFFQTLRTTVRTVYHDRVLSWQRAINVRAQAPVEEVYYLKEAQERYGRGNIQIALWRNYNESTGKILDRRVAISAAHVFSSGPYGDTVPFAVGSNEAILSID